MMKMNVYREAKQTLVHLRNGHRLVTLRLDFLATTSCLTPIFTTGTWCLLPTVTALPLVAMCKSASIGDFNVVIGTLITQLATCSVVIQLHQIYIIVTVSYL